MRATEKAGGHPLGRHPSTAQELTEGEPPDGRTTHQATRRKSRRAVEMSFFIVSGVVIALGASTGMMWRDRGLSFRSAAKKPRRRPS